jgi:hypothetical protein
MNQSSHRSFGTTQIRNATATSCAALFCWPNQTRASTKGRGLISADFILAKDKRTFGDGEVIFENDRDGEKECNSGRARGRLAVIRAELHFPAEI